MPETKYIALAILLFGAASAGCSEFPCLDEASVHTIPPVEFGYEEKVRYTYWFEDGAQRVTFDRDQIPIDGRGSVLVHIDGKTAGGLHGAAGWAADVTDEEQARAHFVPMAMPRAAAYSAWVGAWRASWMATKAGILVQELEAQRKTNAALGLGDPDDDGDALDPDKLIAALKPEADDKDAAVTQVTGSSGAPADLRDELQKQGISLDGLKLTRALRVVGAREPFPRDFGLSIDVHPIWVFVSPDCSACDEATAWLDEQGLGYHGMLIADPTNAKTLKALSARAGIEEPAVPTLWKHGKLLRGFDASAWKRELRP